MSAARFSERAQRAIAADRDHFDPATITPDELAWLAAQLAEWPTRVDERFTTNHRFLRMSAAAFILASTKNTGGKA